VALGRVAVERPTQEARPTQEPRTETPPAVEQAADTGAAAADTGTAPAEAEPQPEEAPAETTLTPEQILTGMVERFRVLFEGENEAALSRELYKGTIPGGDRRIYNAVFGGADEIEITRFDRQINVNGNSARADVQLRMRFRQGTTREWRERDLRLRLDFEASGPGEWRLRRVST
jgi:hypothetical protein